MHSMQRQVHDIVRAVGERRLRVGLVSEHHLFRDVFAEYLRDHGRMDVVWGARTLHEAIGLLDDERPDLVVVDYTVPRSEVGAAARAITCQGSECKLMFLSRDGGEYSLVEALTGGANGYALMQQSVGTVVEAMRSIGEGHQYFPPGVPPIPRAEPKTAPTGDPLALLSPREKEVFWLLVRGDSNQGIAGHLGISARTVETHRARLLKKLGLHSMSEVVRFAARNGLPVD